MIKVNTVMTCCVAHIIKKAQSIQFFLLALAMGIQMIYVLARYKIIK